MTFTAALRRVLPAAITLAGYLFLLLGLGAFDPRYVMVAAGAIAIYEGREATR